MDLHFLFATDHNYMTLFFRLVLGCIIFPYGMQKLLGWFGGEGLLGTISHMASVGMPSAISWLTIIGQSFGSVAILLGLFTRIAAGGIFILMAGAMVINIPNGWLMNWAGKKKGEGIEYFILLLAINIYVLLNGAGPLSFDALISQMYPTVINEVKTVCYTTVYN